MSEYHDANKTKTAANRWVVHAAYYTAKLNGAIDAKARNARKHSRNLNLSLSRRRQSHPLRRSCRQ